MSERSNIRDVAAEAGVSVKTVSRVLNNHPYVGAATRAKVLLMVLSWASRTTTGDPS